MAQVCALVPEELGYSALGVTPPAAEGACGERLLEGPAPGAGGWAPSSSSPSFGCGAVGSSGARQVAGTLMVSVIPSEDGVKVTDTDVGSAGSVGGASSARLALLAFYLSLLNLHWGVPLCPSSGWMSSSSRGRSDCGGSTK